MTKKEKEKEVLNALQYLIDEGFVLKLSDGSFRLKTEKELKKELKLISDS